jgi:hypothetical protein
MSRPQANDVRVSAHGLVVVGRRPTVTTVYFRPTGVTRLQELPLRFEAPAGAPATLLPDGRLLVVGLRGESLLVSAGRTPQPGPTCPVPLDGLSSDGVAYTTGGRFFRFVAGAWVEEAAVGEAGLVAAVGEFAVGGAGAIWAAGKGGWSRQKSPTTVALGCAAGAWAGGVGVVVEREGKRFVAHQTKGTVSSLAPWKDHAVLVVDGRVVDLSGKVFKAPGTVSAISSHQGSLWCVANGSLFETSDLTRYRRQVLPS